MWACLSCTSSPSTFNNIRVVHLNGCVEYFDQPISACQVIGNPPKHFLCTSIQLLSSSSKPLVGDTQLQPGIVYFMLPYTILQSDVSPLDLACLAKRLTTIAKTRDKSLKNGMNMRMNEGERRGCRLQPWKPILDTIKERSFNMRSESDLQELELITRKERKKISKVLY
ncbi:hypothetical protein TanjilG_13448 [Lupinus angustifolius]|uniref:DUF4228 domain-containing protein n=1 Tax=Lupinus angustifolius TaxID=3871 RepID=A0A4P1RV93_LUPAN|nr:PREDICTED: uncharacterized protein LOC109355820 [Lupinus angustifolius]OIW18696.1 hypothetical protein TanjilG_13448 [Lupinus angustifolius]